MTRMDGKKRTRTYNSWSTMIQRTSNPKAPDYPTYGGKGVRVCDRWRSFDKFYEDMGERPVGKTLDRIDSSGHYDPDNCRWSDLHEQNNNRSTCVRILFQGNALTVKESSQLSGVPEKTIYARKSAGKSVEAILKKRNASA